MPENNVEAIQSYREQIDEIDAQLVELLNKRATAVFALRELKSEQHQALFDSRREVEVYEHVRALNKGPLYDDNLESIYAAILRIMKEMSN